LRTVREKLQARIEELDARLRRMVEQVPAEYRGDTEFQKRLNELLAKRSALMLQRDLGFMITDRRKVRG